MFAHLEHLIVDGVWLLLRGIHICIALSWLLRLYLWLILCHFNELTTQRLIAFLLQVLGSLSRLHFVFIETEVKLQFKAIVRCCLIFFRDFHSKLSSNSFGQMFTEFYEIKFLELNSGIGLRLRVAPA